MDDEVLKHILLNQKYLLKGISSLLTPNCRGVFDRNNETQTNVKIIDRLHETEELIKRKFGEVK